MLRVAKLSDQQWGRAVSNGHTETQEEASSDEHREVYGSALKHNGKDHDNRTDTNTPSAAQTISDVGGNGQGKQRSQKHDSGKETLDRGRQSLHVVRELVQGQQTVDHRAIVTVCCLSHCQFGL